MPSPEISEALLEYLDRVFPVPDTQQTDREILIALAQREVGRKLRVLYNEQNGITKD